MVTTTEKPVRARHVERYRPPKKPLISFAARAAALEFASTLALEIADDFADDAGIADASHTLILAAEQMAEALASAAQRRRAEQALQRRRRLALAARLPRDLRQARSVEVEDTSYATKYRRMFGDTRT